MAGRISERVLSLYAALIKAGCGGKLILKSDVEKLLMEKYGISIATTRFYIDTGRALELWTMTDRRAKENALKLPSSGPNGLLILERESTQEIQVEG